MIVPRLVALLAVNLGGCEPLASRGRLPHQLQAVDTEQIAAGQVHHVERSAAADGIVDIASIWYGVAIPSAMMRAASAQ